MSMEAALDKINYEEMVDCLYANPLQGIYKFNTAIGTITAYLSCTTDKQNITGTGLIWVLEEATLANTRLGKVGNMCKDAREYIAKRINEIYW